jgi:hypothetical protein
MNGAGRYEYESGNVSGEKKYFDFYAGQRNGMFFGNVDADYAGADDSVSREYEY